MKPVLILGAVTALAACEPVRTPEGCPIYLSPIMQVRTEACLAAHREAEVIAQGGTVTRCTPVGAGMSCTSY